MRRVVRVYTGEPMVVSALPEPLVLPLELGPHRRQDYLRLADEPRCELIYGRFYVSPAPTVLHQIIVALLWQHCDAIARSTGGLALLSPVDVALAEHSIVQPDVVYLARERRAVVTTEGLEGAPNLVVEVLSKGTTRRDRGEKLKLYAESGIEEYWLVDPAERQIEFLVNRSGEFVVVLPEGPRYRSSVLSEVELDLEQLWRDVEQRIGATEARGGGV